MALTDCTKCWQTPCVCGYEYKNYTTQKKLELAAVVLNIKVEVLTELAKDHLPKMNKLIKK